MVECNHGFTCSAEDAFWLVLLVLQPDFVFARFLTSRPLARVSFAQKPSMTVRLQDVPLLRKDRPQP